MPHVDNSQITPLTSNTVPGNTANAVVFPPAMAAFETAINENYDEFQAFKAALELPIPDQSIVTRHLRNLAVTSPKLAALAVTADKIADGSITLAKLADLVVTAAKIANETITEPKYASGSVSNRALSPQSVTVDKLDPTLITPISDAGVQAEFNKRAVNVQSFGAKGDGITDDSAAIQSAINAVSLGGRVFFPSGNYLVTDSFLIPSYVTVTGIYGKSRIFRNDGGFYIFRLQGATEITVENLVFDGGIVSANPGGSDEQKHVIVCSELTDSSIVRCIINNAGGDGIYLGDNATTHASSNNVLIDRCIINQVGRNCISITGAINCKVSYTKVSGARGPILGCGIDIEPNISDTCIGNIVDHCVFYNCKYGLTISALNPSKDRITYGHVVSANTAYGCEIGIQCSATNTKYIDNLCFNNEYAGLNISGAANSIFKGNTIIDNGLITSTNGQAIITGSTNILFSENHVLVSDPASTVGSVRNLYLSGACVDVVVTNNVLYPFKTGGASFTNAASSGNQFLHFNLAASGELRNNTILDMYISDAMKTFLTSMNFYKGIGVGNFSLRKGTPASFTDLWTVDNNGNTNQIGVVKVGGTQVVGSRQAAIPDTSGATLSALETEVNKLKAMLRVHGLMS